MYGTCSMYSLNPVIYRGICSLLTATWPVMKNLPNRCWSIHVHVYNMLQAQHTYVRTHACVHIRACARAHHTHADVYTYTYTHTCTLTYTNIHRCIHTRACTQKHTYAHTCTYTHMYTCRQHAHTQTHTHTYTT